ncbi:MAG: helix-turn-helix domain-containing protein [Oscillibacter sp.]|nr:helix-turn-helix domain-containing protein [Oscillibacter sp.]
MKESVYKSYDELPLFLNAETVAKVLGVSPSNGYELMHEPDFPALRIGNRIVIPKEAFIRWVEDHTGGIT